MSNGPWEALFRVWHERAHEDSIKERDSIIRRLEALEAQVRARLKEEADDRKSVLHGL